MSSLFRRIATACAAMALCATALADIKLTTRTTTAGQTTEGTTYVKGARQRSEMQMGPMRTVTIMQCDKKQIVTISDACRTYMVAPMEDDTPGTASSAPPPSSSGSTRQGGTLTINNNTVNTGETKTMFGYRARHIKSTMSMSSSPDACTPVNMKMESDGWYADFSGAGLSCATTPRPGGMGGMGGGRPECRDRIRYTGSGMRNLGYPLDVTTTTTDGSGNSYTMRQETTELSKETLDPALFDIPEGYRQVNDYQGLMCSAAMTGGGAPPPARTSRRRSGRGPLCVAPFENRTSTAVNVEQWRDTLISELESLRVESVKLESEHPFDLEDEARAKGCRVVLYSDITDAKAPARGRRLGSAVGAGVSSNYQSGLKVELMPLDDFKPWLEKTVSGLGPTLDESGGNALTIEAQEVATELSKPH